MRKPISLKWFIALAVLSLGLILVIGYSILTAQYFMRGMDNIIAANMESAVLSFAKAVPAEQFDEAHAFDGYVISSQWNQLPEPLRKSFGTPPARIGVLQKHDASGFLQRPDIVHFLMRLQVGGGDLLIGRTFTRATASRLVGRNIARSMTTLLLIGTASALAFAVILWLLMRRVSQPVAALGIWARELDPDRLADPTPDFVYPELNDLAQLTKNNMATVLQAVERERRFLRHASHELRTPISVIRNNVELIGKLRHDHASHFEEAQGRAFDRIDRASRTMQHLTETLLWLSLDEAVSLPTQSVSMGEVVRQLVDDTRYLLADKNVEVVVDTDASVSEISDTAARIVLGNLIRNAFQHTWEGEVMIVQRGNDVRIVNRQTDGGADDNHDAAGFGLGLQLTEQLAKRLDWPYRNESMNEGRLVEVTLRV